VSWWRTLHQPATIKSIGDVDISGSMLFSLFVGVVAFTLVYVWLMFHKTRIMVLEDELDDRGLDLALEERRAEAALEEIGQA
jgi:heme exporter protein C